MKNIMIKEVLNEIDNAKPDGWSTGFIVTAILLILTAKLTNNFGLFIVSFIGLWYLSLAFFLMPYAKKIESRLFNVENIFLKRFFILIIKGMGFIVALFGGLMGLYYWA